MHLAVCADSNRFPHGFQKPGRAVGIRFSRRIISMGADINIRLFLFINAGCQTCRHRNHEAVPKRNIRRYLSRPLFRNLLTVTFVYNTLRRMGQKRTIGILHDLRQIKFIMRHMVICRHRSCGIQFLFMLLSIKNRSSADILCSQCIYSHGETSRRVHTAAG